MANVITDENQRKLPLKKPEGWVPKMPRWTLDIPSDIKELAVAYIGVQSHSEDTASHATEAAISKVETWVKKCQPTPVTFETFEVVSGRDVPGSKIWNCYFLTKTDLESAASSLDLTDIHESLGSSKSAVGIWLETMFIDMTRFETNYSGTDYQPGLAKIYPDKQVDHNMTGYWGAARDRMYASAYDPFDGSAEETQPHFDVKSQGAHLTGTNAKTIAHIRSGQFWENCPQVEREAYEEKLEPHLRAGLDDIFKRPADLGDFGLRFLRNCPIKNEDGSMRRETCAAGYFRSLSDLEAWAKGCPSHHKIFGGALHHKNTFKEDQMLRTWHEVCVLKPGEAKWEYVNCLPTTGTIPFQPSQVAAAA